LSGGYDSAELTRLLDELSELRLRKERCMAQIKLFNSRDAAIEQSEMNELELAIRGTMEDRSKAVQILEELAAEEEKMG
jgi:hypothetical protein